MIFHVVVFLFHFIENIFIFYERDKMLLAVVIKVKNNDSFHPYVWVPRDLTRNYFLSLTFSVRNSVGYADRD